MQAREKHQELSLLLHVLSGPGSQQEVLKATFLYSALRRPTLQTSIEGINTHRACESIMT